MTARRALALYGAIALVRGGGVFVRREAVRPNTSPAASSTATQAPGRLPPPTTMPQVAAGSGEAPSPIADLLNAPNGTVRQDLAILGEVFAAWQSNFPRVGNPVGENAEITAALTGENPLKLVIVRPDHPALNERRELVDRWGTPFRFHQVSAELMEVRTAGPDRKFGTGDDSQWPPDAR